MRTWAGLRISVFMASTVMALAMGCHNGAAVLCSDGQLCPPGHSCTAGQRRCVLEEQVAGCEGPATDGNDCSYPGEPDGVCAIGLCVPRGCGNEVVDGDEVCDDGNTDDGDQCAADCASDESCGNGIVDRGEWCDDGMHCQDGTGCSEASQCAGIGNSQCSPRDGDDCPASCANPSCGDGIVDSRFGEECDCGSDLDSIPEGCTGINADAPDACRPTCRLSYCGDGIADFAAGELCDDGNYLPGDGCTGVCATEVCGNGVIDVVPAVDFGFVPAEECDDGNFISLDGCSDVCRGSAAIWDPQGVSPSERSGHAMAYDAARSRVVVFGGELSFVSTNDTWEWNGASWTDVTPGLQAESPIARTGHGMAYDAARGRVVMFGGETAQGVVADIWEWDGNIWTNVTPPLAASSPSARKGHAMAYDSARHRVVMFGGRLAGFNNNARDTWEWDGATWVDVTPNSAFDSPSVRGGHAMAYEPVRGRVVVFGGRNSADKFSDTWEWNGVIWTEVTPPGAEDSPTERDEHGMAYDAMRGRVVMFGGSASGVNDAGTWEWDGSTWTEVTPSDPSDSPTARSSHAMAFDVAQGRVVVFGGMDTSVQLFAVNDTWMWSGEKWEDLTLAHATQSPPARTNHAMATDRARGQVVMFGGNSDTGIAGDTWQWNGTIWTDATPVQAGDSPPARRFHGMAYDTIRERVVAFGGQNSSYAYVADTWEWDGTGWTDATPISAGDSPGARVKHAMAYDAARGRVIVFGGQTGGSADDTWEWGGAMWKDVTPQATESPGARYDHAMAYDAARERVVLFGGLGSAGKLADTWEWDGAAWMVVTPLLNADSPPARFGHAMAYDASRERVVVFGGSPSNGVEFGDVWEWDGAIWTDVTPGPADAPSARYDHAMAYDAARGRMVVFGGLEDRNSRPNDTWLLSHRVAGPEACHSGLDADGDGLVGCDEPDCWGYCMPRCPPDSTPQWPQECDATVPRCGDGACNTDLESHRLCPADCALGITQCGDFHCDTGENIISCPGDCPP